MKKTMSYSLLLWVAMTKMALAACNFTGYGREGTVILDFGDISVLPTTPIGDVVATAGGSSSQIADAVGVGMGAGFMRCEAGDLSIWSGSSYGTIEHNGNTFLDSGIPGLAIQTSTRSTSGSNGDAVGLGVKFPPDYSGMVLNNNQFTPYQYGQRKFELVKIGPVEGGIIPGGTLVTNTIAGTRVITWQLNPSNVSVSGCEASDTGVPDEVSLGSAYSQQFRNPGDSQNETNFSITLNCSSTNLRPTITFEGTIDDAYPTVFSNSSGDGYAKNVGIQLFANDSVIIPGSAVSLGQPTSLLIQHEFGARLFRTSDKVTSGSVDVPVIFTISYE